MDARLTNLLSLAEKRSARPVDRDLISRAYDTALEAHKKQVRRNGEPYFNHVYEAAKTVAQWQLDSVTVAAALLHDTVEDTGMSLERLARDFGQEVAFIVNGVTKISHIKYRGNQAQAETLKKMILALSEDIRVVFVKLADRTHNMRTLQYLPHEKQQRIALETTEIYAPLAYRIGLGSVAGDLEDLAFPFLYPQAYQQLKAEMKEYLEKGAFYIGKVLEQLKAELERHGIRYLEINSRVKRISSLYKKMRRYGLSLDGIYDLVALRIIVDTVDECYAVLGIIHSLWPPLPGKIKDYIALPKPNGYRSLHTTVICMDKIPTEFQIRTRQMHYENEYGIAAYWAYNEGKKKPVTDGKNTVWADARELTWVNQLKAWQQDIGDPDEYINSVKLNFFKDRIFAITPKGEAIDLPLGATPVDFAYAIHSEIGDHCTGAMVNNKIVPLDYELQSGDYVQILTNKNKHPNAAWLDFVKTRQARQHIRSVLRTIDPTRPKTTVYTITGQDRIALLRDISALFSKQKVSILGIETVKPATRTMLTFRITAAIDTPHKADALAIKLRAVPNIIRIEYS